MRLAHSIAVAALVLAIVAIPRYAACDKAARALVIVVAKGSPVKSLTRSQVRRCFSGDTVVIGDERLVPFNLPPGTPERVAFDRVILGMSPEQVGRYWVDRKIRGETQAPRALPSATLVVKIVAKFPSSISYVPADQVTPDVMPVAIDGVLPTSPQYPIMLR